MDIQLEQLKELKRIRFMLEDIWLSSEIPKKEDFHITIIDNRLSDEMEDLGNSKPSDN